MSDETEQRSRRKTAQLRQQHQFPNLSVEQGNAMSQLEKNIVKVVTELNDIKCPKWFEIIVRNASIILNPWELAILQIANSEAIIPDPDPDNYGAEIMVFTDGISGCSVRALTRDILGLSTIPLGTNDSVRLVSTSRGWIRA